MTRSPSLLLSGLLLAAVTRPALAADPPLRLWYEKPAATWVEALPIGNGRLGAMVFAPSRRRPWKVAREAMTVDVLSGGRLVVPVGLGALDDQGFGNVGEQTEARVRAQLLD